MHTYHIHIEGQVQGVGFRPFVYQLAAAQQVTGKVMNTLDGVHIYINTTESGLSTFLEALKRGFPKRAVITYLTVKKTKAEIFTSFKIVHSSQTEKGKLLLTPDFTLCGECLQELHNRKDRRNNYPFITCTNCGPRFSVVKKLPYDRELTTMDTFSMCPACKSEYNNVYNRRYHSQTNSCKTCGVALSLYNTESKLFENETASFITTTAKAIEQGKIVAVKGIGGFLLFCDAANDQVVQELRKRKQRPQKPFALMYPSIEAIEKDVVLLEAAKNLLTSEKAPIVLLSNKKETKRNVSALVAPDLDETGVMLPYSPLFVLLLKAVNRPLIATSANLSGSPVIFTNEGAIEGLSNIADLILMNDRDIVVSQDDSVVRFDQTQQAVIIRRSRGLAPAFFLQKALSITQTILALGANMKSAFTLYTNGHPYISQYLGNLDSFDAQETYKQTIQHFLDLFSLQKAGVVITDKHKSYFATEYGRELVANWNVTHYYVQHHQAHFAAVLAENELLHTEEKVLGVIMDGTGLGDDGQIWGGEFFEYQQFNFTRKSHLAYMPHILGDKMAKEPRVAAFAFSKGKIDALKKNFTTTEWKFYQKLIAQPVKLNTSSTGRLFDAVASILGILQKNTFEGEAAMLLETKAKAYLSANNANSLVALHNSAHPMQTDFILKTITERIEKGESKGYLAACFHYTLVKIIEAVALDGGFRHITFSGGVFQNTLLLDMLKEILSNDFKLYFHHQLSPNDENIAFGQLIAYIIENQLKKKFLKKSKFEKTCV